MMKKQKLARVTLPMVTPVDKGGCGTAPKPTMVAYELPPNTTFGGEVTIKTISQWAAEIVGTSSCGPAVPPPPRP